MTMNENDKQAEPVAWESALEFAAQTIELYDDATMKNDYMLDASECAAIIRALKPMHPAHPVQPPDEVVRELVEALIIAGGSIMEICKERDVPIPHSTMRRIDAAINQAKSLKKGA